MTRLQRCPRCQGAGKVRLGAVYPGTGAWRPLVDCPVCQRTGRVPVTPPTPPRRPFRVTLTVVFYAEGRAHADLLAQEFVREALSSMQYTGSLPPGESATVVRDPATSVEEP